MRLLKGLFDRTRATIRCSRAILSRDYQNTTNHCFHEILSRDYQNTANQYDTFQRRPKENSPDRNLQNRESCRKTAADRP